MKFIYGLFIFCILQEKCFTQNSIIINNFKFENNNKNLLQVLTKKLNQDYKDCGNKPNLNYYKYMFSDLNKVLKTDVFNKITEVNTFSFCSKIKEDYDGVIRMEEFVFDNYQSAIKAYDKYKEYKDKKFNKPTIAPISRYIFLKNDRLIIIYSESIHQYEGAEKKYIKLVTDSFFNKDNTEYILLHR